MPNTHSENDYQYAERIRECWRLWNLGFPFVRPIGYQNGALWYAETIADEYMDVDPAYKELPTKNITGKLNKPLGGF